MEEKLSITPEIYEKAVNFALASVDSSADRYARRNQFSVDKIRKDIRNGRIAEELVHQAFIKQFPNLSAPDYNIYQKGDKSWAPDLKDAKLRLAVKSQDIESAQQFGESWVFQYNDGKKYDCDTGIFKDQDDNHYVAFVLLNVPKRFGIIRGVVKVNWLHQNKLFKEMQKENLRGNKLAVYYDSLEQFKDQLFQL